ncbi:MAG: homoserine dehydrogenase [Ardenticatenaceae bacterium]|nr:homoserine dehydrogenase [Ardenticatenaceae bacterium]
MKHIPVILFGVGGVGRALVQQIVASRDQMLARNACHFELVALADSHHWLWQPQGLSNEQLLAAVAAKQERQPLGDQPRPGNLEIVQQAEAAWLNNVIIVDVTASDGMEPVLDFALERRYGVVLANKKPLAGPWPTARRYFNHPLLRHESTVGGGQPVIATLRYLLDTNDPILRIEGQLSGTLGFICQQMDEGVPFSRALAAAKGRGYTEPDPREDLAGRDVMRKVMILGRMAGWPLEENDIQVESLYPSALAHLSVREFMAAAVALDPALRDRVNAAGVAGEVLRYVAELSAGQGTVGLRPVPMGSALANLKYISFRTGRYNDEPLLIAGKGAGVEMTAAGVLGDMVDLAREAFGR